MIKQENYFDVRSCFEMGSGSPLLEDRLQSTYRNHYEETDTSFSDMIRLFAEDDFFADHFAARAFVGDSLTRKEEVCLVFYEAKDVYMSERSKNSEGEEFDKARELFFAAMKLLNEEFSGYVELVNAGKFDQARNYLDEMPDCTVKNLALKDILEAEEDRSKSSKNISKNKIR